MIALKRLPYPGLRAFTREESDLFFGRDGCVDAMVNVLAATRFLAVLGSSGSGKSSLVRTGLLDALDLGLHPWAGSRWIVADFHPGGHPIRNLSAALLTSKDGVPPEATAVDLLAAFLRRGPRSLAEWVSGGNLEPGSNLLILVDQFEELFRYGNYARQEEAEAFVTLLLETASLKGINIHIVITMRSEFLGACALMPGLAEKINDGLYLTPRMTREECREAIEGPAGVMGFTVEPALITRLLNDLTSFAPWEAGDAVDQAERLARRADQLPLMQHVLNRLWARADNEAGGSRIVLGLSDYDGIGGLSGAIDAHGEEILSALGDERARRAGAVFRSLVSGAGVASAVRRPCRLGELVEVAGNKDDVVAIVEAFSAPDCNFLRTSEQSLSDDVIVDISHESLIRQWTSLRGWLENEARAADAWRRLAAAEERYTVREGGLLTGLDLHNLAAWWESASPTPSWAMRYGGQFERVQSYLAESRREEAARADAEQAQLLRERTRLRRFVAGLALALAVFVGLGILDYISDRRLNKTRAALIQQRKEADVARDDARRQRDAANTEVRRTTAVINDVSNTVDRYKGVVGVSELESDLMKTLFRYQLEVSKAHTNAIEEADIARDDYRRGFSFETIGDARQALVSYTMAYNEGRQAISDKLSDGKSIPEALQVAFIKGGCRYVWYLFDIGEDKKGGEVLQEMRNIIGRFSTQTPSSHLLIALSQFENVEARYYADHKQRDQGKRHASEALGFARRAIVLATGNPDVDTKAFEFTVYRNRANYAIGAEKENLLARACKLADNLMAESPLDARSIKARIDCLQDRAANARRKGQSDEAAKNTEMAEQEALRGLKVDPRNQALLLSMASLENYLANLAWDNNNDGVRLAHATAAKDYIVRALSGRTLFQSNTSEIKNLYDSCCKTLDSGKFPDPSIELGYYKDIVESVTPTLDAFPKAPSFAYVAAEASVRMADVVKDDVKRRTEAEEYLSKAIDWFDTSGAVRDLSVYSEDFSAYCATYRERAKLYGLSGHVDLMLRDIKKMTDVCRPILNKYPWDIYLRDSFLESANLAGAALVIAHRNKEAIPFLEYGSHWGMGGSSKLLAVMYKEGLGVEKDERKAKELETLASTQKFKRLTLTADFGGVKAPVNIYVQDWPAEYPYAGIDDQVIWLKEARGGTFTPETIEAFHTLYKLAHDKKVSFRELTEYAMNPASNTKTGPNDQAKAQYALAISLFRQEKWDEAAKAAENALSLDPDSPDILQLTELIYHDRLFQFDRAYELNARRVELGSGQEDFVEKHLTTGRFDTCADLAAVVRNAASDKGMRLAMTSLEFACLSGEKKTDAALVVGHRLRKELTGFKKGDWTFSGTEHFIGGSPAFAANKQEWVGLFEALDQGNEKKALAELTALGVPE
jgi:tetratricopeptide (TPR) repeat protein